MGDGDGWTNCAAGHRHWGRYGAAGVLFTEDGRSVLQHRAAWTHEGGTWALPGGARDSHEDPVTTALREAREEAAIDPRSAAPHGMWVDDHGGWSYTTVVARPATALRPHAANAESAEVRWWDDDDIDRLPLHHGFAAAWPRLRHPTPPLHLVVDAANVVGSRPDGWWRDRLGATRRLRDALLMLARDGIRADRLPDGVDPGELTALFPAVTLVVEGAAGPLAAEPSVADAEPTWWDAAVTVHRAEHDGDSAVVERAAASAEAMQTVVITADRGLRASLPSRPRTAGPGWLLGLLESIG